MVGGVRRPAAPLKRNIAEARPVLLLSHDPMRLLIPAATLVGLLTLGGCSKSSTEPSSGSPSGSPVILSTTPSQPNLSDAQQIVSVLGHDFETGLVGSLQRPDGRLQSLAASDMCQLTATSFQLFLILDASGDYHLQVKNPSGQTSAPYTVTVRPAAQGSLTLISVSPSTAVASSLPQALIVNGTNFDSTLEAILTAPDSSQGFYTSAAMAGLNASSFALNVTLAQVGTYSLVVRNGSNSISNSLTIDVRRTF